MNKLTSKQIADQQGISARHARRLRATGDERAYPQQPYRPPTSEPAKPPLLAAVDDMLAAQGRATLAIWQDAELKMVTCVVEEVREIGRRIHALHKLLRTAASQLEPRPKPL